MNREIRYINHRLRILGKFSKDFKKLKRFDLSEVFDDVLIEIGTSLKKLNTQITL